MKCITKINHAGELYTFDSIAVICCPFRSWREQYAGQWRSTTRIL